MLLDLLRLTLFPALMAYAACSDLMSMTISNRVSIFLVIGFFVLALAGGMPAVTLLTHVGAGLLMLVVGFVCFAFRWIGGGDAKIVASAALWFGFTHLLEYLVYASLFGGALTLLLLEWRRWPLPYGFVNQGWLLRLHAKESGIPYGIALALGALLVYPQTSWIREIHFVP
jgi:prepilin peptidase CpaA